MSESLLLEGVKEKVAENFQLVDPETINIKKKYLNVGVVYKSLCLINNKIYIGITAGKLSSRISSHVKLSNKNLPKYLFHRAIKKYGKNNFIFTILDTYSSFEERDRKEMFYIKLYNSFYMNGVGYNMTLGGDGSKGHVKSPEAIEKIKIARSKQVFSIQSRKNMSESRKGKKRTEEQKAYLSARIIELGSHVKSEKTKEKIRLTLTGKTFESRYGLEKSNIMRHNMSVMFKQKQINVKKLNSYEKELILELYKTYGLHKVCMVLKEKGINLGHSSVRRFLIEENVYNLNGKLQINQYK